MYSASKVFGCFESALDERFVDDYLSGDVGQLASLPGFDLLRIGSKLRCISVR